MTPTRACYPKDLEQVHFSDHQSLAEGITTLTTATIPFAGRAIPAMVVLGLVPLQLGTGKVRPLVYPTVMILLIGVATKRGPSLNPSPPFLDQRGKLSPFPPLPPQPSVDYAMTGGDITIDPRYSEYTPLSDSFPIAPQTVLGPELRYGYHPPGHSNLPQEQILDGLPAAPTSPGVAVYPPLFNQAPSEYLISGHPPSGSTTLVSRDVIRAPRLSTFRPLLGQTYQSHTAGPIRGVAISPNQTRYQCIMCDANYAQLSGLNRHYKDKHLPRVACDLCGLTFSSGRAYLLTEHLETNHPSA